MDSIKQHNLFDFKEFELLEDCLKIREKSSIEYTEITISYEKITKDIRVYRQKSILWLVISIAIFFITLSYIINEFIYHQPYSGSWLFWGFLFIASISLYYASCQNFIKLMTYDGGFILFFGNKPSKEKINDFIDNLINKRNTYLKSKYSKVDPDYPIDEQLYKIKWLLDEKLITDEEFQSLKIKLLKDKYGSLNNSLGFRPDNT